MVQSLIQKRYAEDSIPCLDSNCNAPTRYIFGKSHITDLQARYRDSVQAFLVLCREKETGRLVGFEDGYIDSIDTIAQREFQHYNPQSPISMEPSGSDWISHMKSQVNTIL